MTHKNLLFTGALLPLLLLAACTSDSSPPAQTGTGGAASGGSGGGSGLGGSGGQAGSGSGGQAGSGSGGATGGSAGGAGGGDAGVDLGGGDTADVAPSADTAISGVVVDTTTGNGKFTIMSQPLTYVHPDAMPKEGVPRGTTETITITGRVFAGPRMVHVYKPAGYVANTPVAFMVLFDNTDYIDRFKVPTILDNYLAARKLPPIVAIFIAESLNNRSLEYDSITDNNTRYVVEDVFPEVEKLGIKLTTDPDGSSVGGHSSGGIAAFTMGWLRPERFRRILTHSGSFVDLQGGDAYYDLIRNTRPIKPLRVLLTAGTMDANSPRWQQANERMHTEFMMAGYPYRYLLIQGGTHDQRSPAATLPEDLLWLWAGYPLSGATR